MLIATLENVSNIVMLLCGEDEYTDFKLRVMDSCVKIREDVAKVLENNNEGV